MPVHPTPRSRPRVAAGLAAAVVGFGVASSANEPPAVVFRTRPASQGGVISGRGPLDVTFNMCPTSDADPGDQLKFTYDFDGNGSVDYYGHCRQSHRYPVSAQCQDAVVCVTDRQPGHQMCRTYTVCSLTGKPPGPSPSASPDIRPFTYDLYSFTGASGTNVDVSVDTVSAATAFDPWACISKTPEGCVLFDENVIEWGDDDQACTYPPPSYECPSFSVTLPADDDDGIYYLLVSDAAEDDFAGPVGLYSLRVGSGAALGPLVLLADNAHDPKEEPPLTMGPTAAKAVPSGGGQAERAKPLPSEPAEELAPSSAGTGQSEGPPAAARSPRVVKQPRKPGVSAPPADPGTPPAIVSVAGSADAPGRRPEAVFKTEPRASAKGRITGGLSFEVAFDLCGSTDPDPGDALTFSYDFDGDGTVDDAGRCRQTHRYEFQGPACVSAVACVGDGQKDHEACRTYMVCGRERAAGEQ